MSLLPLFSILLVYTKTHLLCVNNLQNYRCADPSPDTDSSSSSLMASSSNCVRALETDGFKSMEGFLIFRIIHGWSRGLVDMMLASFAFITFSLSLWRMMRANRKS